MGDVGPSGLPRTLITSRHFSPCRFAQWRRSPSTVAGAPTAPSAVPSVPGCPLPEKAIIIPHRAFGARNPATVIVYFVLIVDILLYASRCSGTRLCSVAVVLIIWGKI